MFDTLARLKGSGAVDILALVVSLFGLFRQIAAGARMRTAAAERTAHHGYSSSSALACLRAAICLPSLIREARLLISL